MLDDGAEHRVPITQAAWAVPLEHGSPVRRFTSRKGQRHLTGRRSWGQPDPCGDGDGGKRPRQSRNVPALPDGAGPASGMERSTRGTGVYVSQGWIGSNLADMGRERCVSTCFGVGTPGSDLTTGRENTVKCCGVAVVLRAGESPAHREGRQRYREGKDTVMLKDAPVNIGAPRPDDSMWAAVAGIGDADQTSPLGCGRSWPQVR